MTRPAYTKQHFKAVAKVLSKHKNASYEIEPVVNTIIRDLADLFAKKNDRFDRDRFYASCGVKGYVT